MPVEHVVLPGVTWSTYEALLADVRRRLRLTYDRGDLEITSLQLEHQCLARRIGRTIEALTEELGVPIRSLGGTTWRREDPEKGLEPDECYYVAHEADVRGRDDLDLDRDPPPDLAVEVDITRSALNRLGIYAALGVPEVWRYADGAVHFLVRAEDGTYRETPTSRAFPALEAQALTRFLAESRATDETTWIRGFRAWVRRELLDRQGG